jgi:hypothetical protein
MLKWDFPLNPNTQASGMGLRIYLKVKSQRSLNNKMGKRLMETGRRLLIKIRKS